MDERRAEISSSRVTGVCRAFTLVEVLIVVAILGIIAALIVPEYHNYSQKAKESAAKENLQTLRTAIERYAIKHNDTAPGYLNNDKTQTPIYICFCSQIIKSNDYLSGKVPENPFNRQSVIKMFANNEDFPQMPIETDYYGWLYKPASRTIKLNWPGTDSEGTAYFDY
jgi:general secretion pathway protein G